MRGVKVIGVSREMIGMRGVKITGGPAQLREIRGTRGMRGVIINTLYRSVGFLITTISLE